MTHSNPAHPFIHIGLIASFLLMGMGGAHAQELGGELSPVVKGDDEEEGPKGDEASAEEPARVYSLGEVLEQALGHAAAIEVEEAGIRHSEWQQYRAENAWGPKIEADSFLAPVPADTDPNDISNNFDTIADFNIGPFFRQTARLILPVFAFGKGARLRKLAAVGVENAQREYRKAELDLKFQVKRAYFGLQLARAFDGMLTEGEKLVREKLAEMQDARDFGEADFDISDFRKLEIFAAELDTRILDNQKLITLGLAGIQYLSDLKLELNNIPELDSEAEPPALATLQHYQGVAANNRPEVAQLDGAIAAREATVGLRYAQFFPDVFIVADFNYGVSTEDVARQQVQRRENDRFVNTDLSTPPFRNPYDSLGFGIALGMRWRFDYFQLRGQYREAESKLAQTRAQRRQALGAIELEIKKLYLEADQARDRIDIQARRLEAARRWRDQLGLSMQSAGADVADAIEPLQAYYQAKVLHMQAHLDYKIARAALAKGIGVDDLEEAGFAPAGPRRGPDDQ